MSASVGRVDLDLGINQKGLSQQIKGIGNAHKKEFQSLGKSLGSSLGHTFSVAIGNMMANLAQTAIQSLGGFFKSSVELGSSIAELENVTSTVFPNMTSQLESFSKTAIQQYGLTEMQAKKMLGTMGAMAQAFGYNEQEAYNMSTSLTGLVGDVASFYNLDHDVAYTKIKSVFTGETESLKELGIVMTQTALDEFALQQGMGKTTKNMSEQEKVALRLAFVTDKLSFAAGDFNKTQNQWANQTRILSGQWDSFKAALGQGFIAVLTPVIQELNRLMAVVVRLGEKFRDFIMLVTGHDTGGAGTGGVIQEVSEATTAAADTASTASKQASSAAKKVQKSLMGFDKLNKLQAPAEGSGGSSGGGGSGTMPSTPIIPDPGKSQESANTVVGALDTVKKKLEEISSWTGLDKLWAGIQAGIKKIDFSAIKKNFTSIFNSLKPIAQASFNGIGEVLRSVMNLIGTLLGEKIALIGKKIEIVSGGISKFLSSQSGVISNWISVTATKISTGFDNLTFSAENIFGAFWEALDINQVAIENSISESLTVLSDGVMTIGTIFADMWEGLTAGLLDFTTNEKSLITDFFSGIIESFILLQGSINEIVGGIFGSIRGWWENDGKRIWGEIVEVFFDLIGWVMKIWNEIVKPVIDELSNELSRLWEKHLKPLWDNILSFITSVWNLIKALWDTILKPVINWIIDNIGPAIMNVGRVIVQIVGTMIGHVVDAISGLIRSLKGVIEFITGVFTGDWKKAWNGIKNFFGGIWDMIWSVIKSTINLIISGINALWSGLYSSLRTIVNGVGKAVSAFGELIGKDWGFSIPAKSPLIPRLAEGGYVGANQPMLAMIGDNKRHGEIVAPEDKLYEIVSKALQAFMGQLIMALNANNPGSQKANEMMQLIIQLGEETIVNRIIKMVNAESRRQGKAVIKI